MTARKIQRVKARLEKEKNVNIQVVYKTDKTDPIKDIFVRSRFWRGHCPTSLCCYGCFAGLKKWRLSMTKHRLSTKLQNLQ